MTEQNRTLQAKNKQKNNKTKNYNTIRIARNRFSSLVSSKRVYYLPYDPKQR